MARRSILSQLFRQSAGYVIMYFFVYSKQQHFSIIWILSIFFKHFSDRPYLDDLIFGREKWNKLKKQLHGIKSHWRSVNYLQFCVHLTDTSEEQLRGVMFVFLDLDIFFFVSFELNFAVWRKLSIRLKSKR